MYLGHLKSNPNAFLELGIAEEPLGLIVRIHKTILESVNVYVNHHYKMATERPILPLPAASFTAPRFSANWGFGEEITPLSDHESLFWQATLPIPSPSPNNNAEVKKLAATLYLLFKGIDYWLSLDEPDLESIKGNRKQLIYIDDIILSGYQECGLTAECGTDVVGWIKNRLSLNQKTRMNVDEISNTMGSVYAAMEPKDIRKGSIYAEINTPPGLQLHMLRDGVYMYSDRGEHGFSLEPHNIDCDTYVITFIAGIAKLCDIVRG